jgi:Uma2 family endonuclease
MSSLPKPRYTPQQYLEMERQAEFRSEYVNGEILAMAGASPPHNRITLNIGSALTIQLAQTPCEPYATDMPVKVSPTRYTYPDVVVACQPEFEKAVLDLLINPLIIVEVLSPSTEPNDRGWKFAYYRRSETVMDYVLVAQDRPLVEHYTRFGQDLWTLRELDDLSDVLRLPSIGCELPLSQIYARVEFSSEDAGV